MALHELHNDVEFAAEFADFILSADVRMVQCGSGARLVQHQFQVDFSESARPDTTFRATSRCAPRRRRDKPLRSLRRFWRVSDSVPTAPDQFALFLAPAISQRKKTPRAFRLLSLRREQRGRRSGGARGSKFPNDTGGVPWAFKAAATC